MMQDGRPRELPSVDRLVSSASAPLTLGTAGHIDHGKTALVAALTGVDTDRLPEERIRGMSIELGYAPLTLPDGRQLSVVDVPGHERFVRTMVAGAAGIDLFLMTVAADDGVMPQTREHAAVLAALGVRRGVLAITKADRMEPGLAAAEASELLPGVEIVPCSARTGDGVAEVASALARVAAELPGRADSGRPAVLHVDRVFTIHGAGTVVTGTLWSGTVARGDSLRLLPAGRELRVRGVQVHDQVVDVADAGQRVALNLSGVAVQDVRRGDALVAAASEIEPALILDCALELDERSRNGQRAQIHHGTRNAPGRLVVLGDGLWQIRLEQPLLAAGGDRVVVRSVAPPDTLGGGVVLDPHARRHGRRSPAVARLERLRRGEPEPEPDRDDEADRAAATAAPSDPAPSPESLALEATLRAAGHEPLSITALGGVRSELAALRSAGIAIRVGRDMYAHAEAIEAVRRRVVMIIEAEGSVTLARLRDELSTSRKFAQMLIEHLDAARVTKRLPDDRRVLRGR
jgi:selenocysteine-specific elongation factor